MGGRGGKMKEHNESTLPKWAQKRLNDLRYEIERRESLKKLHGLLVEPNREWFTIPGPKVAERYVTLFSLHENNAHATIS